MCKHLAVHVEQKAAEVGDGINPSESQERTFYYCDLERVGSFSELKRCEGATECWWFKERHPNEVDVKF